MPVKTLRAKNSAPTSAQPSALTPHGGGVPMAASVPRASASDMPLVQSSADAGRFTTFPQFGQMGRSGLLSAGALPISVNGSGAQRVYNPDAISLAEYDEMSLYPVIRSALLGYALIMQTADLSVSCADASMKALVEDQLVPLLPKLIREIALPRLAFGWADAEICWESRYNVSVPMPPDSRNQSPGRGPGAGSPPLDQNGRPSDGGDQAVRVYPFVTAVRDFVPLPNSTLTLRQTAQGEFAGAMQWAWGLQFLPPSKLLHAPFMGLFRNPYGQPFHKACYPFWVWARFLWEMMMVAVERGAVPPLLGRYPMGMRVPAGVDAQGRPQQTDAGDFMMAQLQQMRSFATATFPRQLDAQGHDLFDVAELELNAHVDWFTQAIELCHQQMLLGCFFPDKIMQGGDVGSYALAKEHTDLLSLSVKAMLDDLLGHVNDGPVRQFVRFNDRKCPPATVTYQAPNAEIMQAFAMTAVQSIASGQCLVGVNQDQYLVPDWQKWADDLGIPYDVVRRTDGLDAFGRPLQAGVSPDEQDAAGPDGMPGSAAGAGPGDNAPDGAQGGQAGGFNSGDVPGALQGGGSVSPDDELLRRDLARASLTETAPERGSVTLAGVEGLGGGDEALTLPSAKILGATFGGKVADHAALVGLHGGSSLAASAHIGQMQTNGLLQKVAPSVDGKGAKYSATDVGEAAYQVHQGMKNQLVAHLHQNPGTTYHALKQAFPGSPHVAPALVHAKEEGLVDKDESLGWHATPAGQKSIGVTPQEAQDKAVEKAEPKALTPEHAALYQHLKDHGPQTFEETSTVDPMAEVMTAAHTAGHLEGIASPHGYKWGLTPAGEAALAGHQAYLKQQEAAPPVPADAGTADTGDGGSRLSDAHATVLRHVHSQGGSTSLVDLVAHKPNLDALAAAQQAGHLRREGAGVRMTAQGWDALAAHNKATSPAAPEGWNRNHSFSGAPTYTSPDGTVSVDAAYTPGGGVRWVARNQGKGEAQEKEFGDFGDAIGHAHRTAAAQDGDTEAPTSDTSSPNATDSPNATEDDAERLLGRSGFHLHARRMVGDLVREGIPLDHLTRAMTRAGEVRQEAGADRTLVGHFRQALAETVPKSGDKSGGASEGGRGSSLPPSLPSAPATPPPGWEPHPTYAGAFQKGAHAVVPGFGGTWHHYNPDGDAFDYPSQREAVKAAQEDMDYTSDHNNFDPGPDPGQSSPDFVTLRGVRHDRDGTPATPEDGPALLRGLNAHPDVATRVRRDLTPGAAGGEPATRHGVAATLAMARALQLDGGHRRLLPSHYDRADAFNGDLTAFGETHPDALEHMEDFKHAAESHAAAAIAPPENHVSDGADAGVAGRASQNPLPVAYNGRRLDAVDTTNTPVSGFALDRLTGHANLRDLHPELFGDYAPHVQGTYSLGRDANGPRLKFEGTIHHPETHANMGTIQRSWYYNHDGEKEQHNDFLNLSRSYQGHGVAQHLYDKQEDWARRNGFSKVTMVANIDNGPYSWARQGFDFTERARAVSQTHYREQMKQVLDGLRGKGRITPEDYARFHQEVNGLHHSWDFANYDPGPKFDISTLPRDPQTGNYPQGHLGKFVMTDPQHREAYSSVKLITPDASSPHERQAERNRSRQR